MLDLLIKTPPRVMDNKAPFSMNIPSLSSARGIKFGVRSIARERETPHACLNRERMGKRSSRSTAARGSTSLEILENSIAIPTLVALFIRPLAGAPASGEWRGESGSTHARHTLVTRLLTARRRETGALKTRENGAVCLESTSDGAASLQLQCRSPLNVPVR